MFFTSPVSNITPALASVAMSRTDSRDSSTSNSSCYTPSSHAYTSAYASLAMSTSPNWPATSQPLTRTDSNTSSNKSISSSSTTDQPFAISMRRGSSSTWIPSPYRSCLAPAVEEATSYLSDDDLLFLTCSDAASHSELPIESIPNPEPKRELTTEEQIVLLREMQERESTTLHAHAVDKRKMVRFVAAQESSEGRKVRRPSTLKRRSTAVRRGLSNLNGPQ